jgi:hypothetical protein
VWKVDLASYDSVLAFGDRIAQLARLDVAIPNAALSTTNFELAEGFERTIHCQRYQHLASRPSHPPYLESNPTKGARQPP